MAHNKLLCGTPAPDFSLVWKSTYAYVEYLAKKGKPWTQSVFLFWRNDLVDCLYFRSWSMTYVNIYMQYHPQITEFLKNDSEGAFSFFRSRTFGLSLFNNNSSSSLQDCPIYYGFTLAMKRRRVSCESCNFDEVAPVQ